MKKVFKAILLLTLVTSIFIGYQLIRSYTQVKAAYDIYETISQNLGKRVEAYFVDGMVASEDLDRVLEEASQYAKELYIQGDVTNYSYQQGDSCVYIEIDGWLGMIYEVPVKDFLAGSAEGISIVTVEPYVSDLDVWANYLMSGANGPDEAAELIESAFSKFSFSADLDNTAVTVESIKNWPSHSIIIWIGHGGYSSRQDNPASAGSYVKVKVDHTNPLTLFKYRKEIEEGAICLSSAGTLCLTPVFFDRYMQTNALEGSLVYISSCYSAADSKLAQSILNKGAIAFLGNKGETSKNYGFKMPFTFFEALTLIEDGGYMSITEALSYAKTKHGASDGITGSQVGIAALYDFTLPEMIPLMGEVLDVSTDFSLSIYGGNGTLYDNYTLYITQACALNDYYLDNGENVELDDIISNCMDCRNVSEAEPEMITLTPGIYELAVIDNADVEKTQIITIQILREAGANILSLDTSFGLVSEEKSTSEGVIQEADTTETRELTGTTEVTESAEELPVVSDAFYDYQLCQGIYGGNGRFNNFRIPKVNISSEAAEKTNSVIFEELYNKVYVVNQDQAGLGIPAGMNYTWTEHEGIISIIVCWQHGDLTGHASNYYQTYNILKETGQLLSSAELAGRFGLTEAEFIELSRDKILEKYDQLNAANLDHKTGQEYYWSNLDEILSDESIRKIKPFVSKRGELCIVAMMHWITSGERYQCLLNVSGDNHVREPRLLWRSPEDEAGAQSVLTQYDVYDHGKIIESFSFHYDEKQLVMAKYSDSCDYSATLKYTYDSEGRLIKADCGEAWLYFGNQEYVYNDLGQLVSYSYYWGGDPLPYVQYQYAYVLDNEGRTVERHEIDPDSDYITVVQYAMYDDEGRFQTAYKASVPKKEYNATGHPGLEKENLNVTFYDYDHAPLVLTENRGEITVGILDSAGETVWSVYLGDADLEYDDEGRIIGAVDSNGYVIELVYN